MNSLKMALPWARFGATMNLHFKFWVPSIFQSLSGADRRFPGRAYFIGLSLWNLMFSSNLLLWRLSRKDVFAPTEWHRWLQKKLDLEWLLGLGRPLRIDSNKMLESTSHVFKPQHSFQDLPRWSKNYEVMSRLLLLLQQIIERTIRRLQLVFEEIVLSCKATIRGPKTKWSCCRRTLLVALSFTIASFHLL